MQVLLRNMKKIRNWTWSFAAFGSKAVTIDPVFLERFDLTNELIIVTKLLFNFYAFWVNLQNQVAFVHLTDIADLDLGLVLDGVGFLVSRALEVDGGWGVPNFSLARLSINFKFLRLCFSCDEIPTRLIVELVSCWNLS